MKKGKHVKKTGSKVAVVAIALALVCCMAVGGTLAWLMDKTETVTNTFTTSGIEITLEESASSLADGDESALTNSYQMIPGFTITKDPKVTVLANSEDCYLFVKLEKSANFDTFMTYEMAEGWTKLEDGVYYREVEKNATEAQPFYVLKGEENKNQLTVKDTVTNEMMSADNFTQPTMKVSAYAIQLYKTNGVKFSVADAWDAINTP